MKRQQSHSEELPVPDYEPVCSFFLRSGLSGNAGVERIVELEDIPISVFVEFVMAGAFEPFGGPPPAVLDPEGNWVEEVFLYEDHCAIFGGTLFVRARHSTRCYDLICSKSQKSRTRQPGRDSTATMLSTLDMRQLALNQ